MGTEEDLLRLIPVKERAEREGRKTFTTLQKSSMKGKRATKKTS